MEAKHIASGPRNGKLETLNDNDDDEDDDDDS